MEIKDVKQAMALQKELSSKLETIIDKIGKDKAPSVASTIKEQEALIARARIELTTSEKEKEIAMSRWGQRVQQRKDTIKRLEQGLKEMQENIKKIEKGRKKTTPKIKKLTPKLKKITSKTRKTVTKKKR